MRADTHKRTGAVGQTHLCGCFRGVGEFPLNHAYFLIRVVDFFAFVGWFLTPTCTLFVVATTNVTSIRYRFELLPRYLLSKYLKELGLLFGTLVEILRVVFLSAPPNRDRVSIRRGGLRCMPRHASE